MKKMNKKGFTIVELVIVIAVIAILAGVMIPTFSSIVTKAQESAALQEARNAYTELYAADIADGAIDGKINGAAEQKNFTAGTYGAGTVTSYDYENGKVTEFNYTASNGKTVTFDGSEWN